MGTRQDTRAAFAAALATVDGIQGYANRPDSIADGDAWPQWRGSEAKNAWVQLDTWVVFVALPNADITADAYADLHVQAIIDALVENDVMYCDSVQPGVMASEAGDIKVLLINGRSE